ncbi:FAD-dependent oxidoreductase [Acuticoccus sp. I52.16.1]|uniref:FAD-dependent oxidoreductase n=1 Tax=Acuticoccus sp. I52.16.1 TaxID=2928472 RepID=UPI001FD58578|nr:FAD-dependent oxidoreductase [Acuticoccus sp. I52.16.1]UOM35252.1 FAD-dependent oxidoreductase [Acuticoccus sp. I52.16.1]
MTLTLPFPDRASVTGKLTPPAERAEIVVVGAGAAGCAAAIEAARAGASVMLIDENPVAPGLIGMDVPLQYGGRAGAAVQNPERLVEQILATSPALAEAFEAGVDVRLSTSVWGAWANGSGICGFPGPVVGVADETRSWLVGFGRLIVATGARDLNFTFAGSDQPGVMGAQAFHALVARYDAFEGKRIVILGSGALAAQTAALAAAHGITVAAIVEARATVQSPALEETAAQLLVGHVPLTAHAGVEGVAGLTVCDIADPSLREEIACDTIVIAVGAVPVIELFDVLGAARIMDPVRGGHIPALGDHGGTSLPSVWAAGDCAGLGGDPEAEGVAAARAALASLARTAEPAATTLKPAGADALAYQLDWARALLDTGGREVMACLCEEVTRGELLDVQPPRYLGWRSNQMAQRDLKTLAADGPVDQDQIKRLTRACMGPCQARRCREQVALTMAIGTGAPPETVPLAGYRAPVRPLPLAVLADHDEPAEASRDWNVWFGIITQWIGYEDIGTDAEKEQMNAGMPY